ncbi:Patched domain-containing protein 3 [Toxocara canis]|uniref:Patched domain-containing protein 3 n=1 Tax=Toxocara canis TaxID=6265 RepID=A0A0B2VTK9_TOXCA|nr:Patched domain-containing protein 3 [Toxocara canis]
MKSFDCIERPLSKLFYRYGRFVALHPLPFVVVPLLITFTCSIGFLHLDPLTDAIYLFTPTNAPSKVERQIIHELWPLHDHNYIPGRVVTQSREVQVIVAARDNANILEPPYSEAIRRLDLFIQNRVKVVHNGRTYRYKDLCLEWRSEGCPANKHVHIINDLFNHGINVTFPTVRFGAASGYIGGALGGVTLSHGPNDTTVVAGAHAWFLVYHLKFHPLNVSYISGIWEKTLQDQLEHYPEDPYIKYTYFHSQTLAEELKRNADSLIPRFVLAFAILVLFSVLCSIIFIEGTFYIDWVLSKPVLSLLGVVNAGMGIVTGIGITNLMGFPYNDIVGVMPFLLVAVGTDNMFLMVSAVRHTNRAYPVPKRIGECMSDAAISILITSLTDAFSFGVGAITTIPAVQIFCVYTCTAISATFIYQITFFCALLSLTIEWESKGLHCICLRPTVSETLIESTSLWNRLFWLGSRADPDPKNVKKNLRDSSAKVFYQDWFAPVLMQPIMRALVAVWFFIYCAIAVYGCTQVKEGLEPVNLLVSDSYAIPHYRILEKYFWHYGAPLQIVVNNAPDLRDPEERQRIKSMVHAFANTKHTIGKWPQFFCNRQIVVNNAPDLRDPEERQRIKSMVHAFANTKHTIGDESVQFWLKEMELYYKNELNMDIVDSAIYGMAEHFMSAKSHDIWSEDVVWEVDRDESVQFWLKEMELYYKNELNMDIVDSAIYGMAEHFMSAKSHDIWSEDVVWEVDSTGVNRIKTFRFLVGLRQISKTYQQEEATVLMREVASRYTAYNITTFMPLWLFTDQYAIVIPNTIQNIVIALSVMIVIAILLIPQPLCSLWVALAIASIDLGVIGFMTLWDVNLDAISMITIIMSIGFSVDYSAHITYGYVISDEVLPKERVRMALGALGWPLTQGATSTILAVVVLADVPAYMIVTFFKTVFLSIVLGLLHGLVFLPVMLSLFVRGSCIAGSSNRKIHDKSEKSMEAFRHEPSRVEDDDVQPYGRYSIYLSRLNSTEAVTQAVDPLTFVVSRLSHRSNASPHSN